MIEHINVSTPMHKNIIEWCLRYGNEIMNNSNEEDNLAYDPIVFNLISRVNICAKRGGHLHNVIAFELDRYLGQAIEKILTSVEYINVSVLRDELCDKLFREKVKELYPSYLIALLCPQSIEVTP